MASLIAYLFKEVNWNRQLSMYDTGNLFKEILY